MGHVWTHFENEPDLVFARALSSANAQEWQDLTPKTARERLRILLIATWVYVLQKPDSIPSELGHFTASDLPDEDRLWIASTLARSPMLLTPNLYPVNLAQSWETHSGEPAKPIKPGSESALPAILVLGLALTGAALTAFVAVQAAEVVDKHLARNSASSEMLAAHGAAIQMIGSHRDAELKQGGAPLPYTQQELDQIAILEQRQRAALESLTGLNKLPPPFDGATESTSTSTLKATFPWIMIAILLFVLLKKEKKHE